MQPEFGVREKNIIFDDFFGGCFGSLFDEFCLQNSSKTSDFRSEFHATTKRFFDNWGKNVFFLEKIYFLGHARPRE
jgi:hypothetical protein